MSDAVLPYRDPAAGLTSGWQGTSTSRDRAIANDADGTTAKWQARVLRVLNAAGPAGLTAKEMRARCGESNPNRVSPSCTILHKAGKIARLEEKRDNHHVYVALDQVRGRPLAPFKRHTTETP